MYVPGAAVSRCFVVVSRRFHVRGRLGTAPWLDRLCRWIGLRMERAVRVLIISDMEGVSGIVKWEQVSGGEKLYEEGRRLYTEEINAAVRGARSAGADEVVVLDCHGAGKGWTFNSLIPELLDDCDWVVQNMWTEY